MTVPMTQGAALAATPLRPDESARFFAAPRFAKLDLLTATFRTHAYAPHTHDTYVVGLIEAGCETFILRGVRHYLGAGTVAFVNPLEVHDGAPHDGGYSYRMSYPSAEMMRLAARAVSGRETGTPRFRQPQVADPEGAALFSAAHRAAEAGVDPLLAEELLTRAYAVLLIRHGDVAPLALRREAGPVERVRALIEQRFGADLTLDEFAAEARLSTHHLIRAFKAELGLTPHAYLIDARVRRAKERLRGAEPLAEIAAALGFADQAHFSRAFKARMGVPPGVYRRAMRG